MIAGFILVTFISTMNGGLTLSPIQSTTVYISQYECQHAGELVQKSSGPNIVTQCQAVAQ